MPNSSDRATPNQTSYYVLLGLHPGASALEIRRAYRELSKRYHPDTTELPRAIATVKFQQLNEAYATLSNPERRQSYDLKIGYSRLRVIQAPSDLNRPVRSQSRSNSAYLDPTDRPLSAGEVFALFILGLTFLGCLLLALAIGLTRGEVAP
ncbi:MAG: J domain-containing protein [Chroococcidiopsidaceae cyanobacterium CP_BM_ER_R8_30]|nr:J domain-containing protein [Chroococcidiopsidaceae cyanobacterium CP_BM_ER_R8_30]